MAETCFKQWTFLFIRMLKSKQLIFHLIPVRIAKINKMDNIHAGKNVEQGGNSSWLGCVWVCLGVWVVVGGVKYYIHQEKQSDGSPGKWDALLQNPAIALLSIYLKDALSYHSKLSQVHCCHIYKNQNLDTTWMFLNRRMDKENVVHVHNWMLLTCKKMNSWKPKIKGWN